MITKSGKRFGAALAGIALLLTAACGGGSRPSTADLQKALYGGPDSVFGSSMAKVSKQGVDCMAKALHDSKLSDAALQAIIDKNKDYKTDEAALAGAQAALMKCISSAAK